MAQQMIEDYGDTIDQGRRKGFDRFATVNMDTQKYTLKIFGTTSILKEDKKTLPPIVVVNGHAFYSGYRQGLVDLAIREGLSTLDGPIKKLTRNKRTVSPNALECLVALQNVRFTCSSLALSRNHEKEGVLIEEVDRLLNMESFEEFEDILRLFYQANQLNGRAYALSGTLALSDKGSELYVPEHAIGGAGDIKRLEVERTRLVEDLAVTVAKLTDATRSYEERGQTAKLAEIVSDIHLRFEDFGVFKTNQAVSQFRKTSKNMMKALTSIMGIHKNGFRDTANSLSMFPMTKGLTTEEMDKKLKMSVPLFGHHATVSSGMLADLNVQGFQAEGAVKAPANKGGRKQASPKPSFEDLFGNMDSVQDRHLPPSDTPPEALPKLISDTFNIGSVEMGDWVAQNGERTLFLTRVYAGLSSIAETLGVSKAEIGIGGRIHIQLGSRGKGKASAHISPLFVDGQVVAAISFPKTRGDGSLGHEYTHALDCLAANLAENVSEKNWFNKIYFSSETPDLKEQSGKDFQRLLASICPESTPNTLRIADDDIVSMANSAIAFREDSLASAKNLSLASLCKAVPTLSPAEAEAKLDKLTAYVAAQAEQAMVYLDAYAQDELSLPDRVDQVRSVSYAQMELLATRDAHGSFEEIIQFMPESIYIEAQGTLLRSYVEAKVSSLVFARSIGDNQATVYLTDNLASIQNAQASSSAGNLALQAQGCVHDISCLFTPVLPNNHDASPKLDDYEILHRSEKCFEMRRNLFHKVIQHSEASVSRKKYLSSPAEMLARSAESWFMHKADGQCDSFVVGANKAPVDYVYGEAFLKHAEALIQHAVTNNETDVSNFIGHRKVTVERAKDLIESLKNERATVFSSLDNAFMEGGILNPRQILKRIEEFRNPAPQQRAADLNLGEDTIFNPELNMVMSVSNSLDFKRMPDAVLFQIVASEALSSNRLSHSLLPYLHLASQENIEHLYQHMRKHADFLPSLQACVKTCPDKMMNMEDVPLMRIDERNDNREQDVSPGSFSPSL